MEEPKNVTDSEWRFYALKELERQADIIKRIPLIEKDIALLNYKSTLWGALGGTIITTIGTLIIYFLSKK